MLESSFKESKGVATFLGNPAGAFRAARLAALALFALCAPVPAQRATGPHISAADIEVHVRALADDELLGRETGSAGGQQAANYIAGVMKRAGLAPGGDDGSYLSDIGVRGFAMQGVPELAALDIDRDARLAVYGEDFAYYGGGPMDATLEVVVVRSADDLPATPRADAALLLVGSSRTWSGWLQKAGAPDGRGWGLLMAPGRDSRGGPQSHAPHGLSVPGEPPLLILRGVFRDRLLEHGTDSVHVRIALSGETFPATNVVGILRGVGTPEDPSLAQQAIVITAHYDHIGVAAPPAPNSEDDSTDADPTGPLAGLEAGLAALSGALTEDEGPDLIYNGADDDASGVAAVLELAEIFADSPPPARTLIFVAVTGEEHNLLGTSYYLDHPVMPLEQTVANINFEMMGRPDDIVGGHGRFWLTGFELTNLGPAWNRAGLSIARDMRPEQHFYERSDNIAFVRRGIIGQTISSYNLHQDYHQVGDEADTLDYRHMETGLRTSFAAVSMLADGRLTPAWTPAEDPDAEPDAEPGDEPDGPR
jgi:hypothetical protein